MTTKKPRQPLGRPVNPRISPCNYARLVGAIVGQSEVEILAKFNMTGHPCEQCGRSTPRNSNKSKNGIQWRRFCSVQCRYDSSRTWVACDECGQLFQRSTKDLIAQLGKRGYQHVWCSKHCQGVHRGRVYGFIAHPENAEGPRKRRYDYDTIWQRYVALDYSMVLVSQELAMPYVSVQSIIRKMRAQHPEVAKPQRTGERTGGRRPGSGGKRIHDYEAIWQSHLATGVGAMRLSRELGISVKVLDKVLANYRRASACTDSPEVIQ